MGIWVSSEYFLDPWYTGWAAMDVQWNSQQADGNVEKFYKPLGARQLQSQEGK